jgi:uncharacterized membrane protein
MSKLSEAKVLGGVGAILSLLVFVPFGIGFLLNLIGLVLIFIAVKYIADETKNEGIFHNYLMNFILQIIAVGAFIAIMIISFGVSGGFSWINAIQQQQQNITDVNSFWSSYGSNIMTLLGGCVLAVIIAWLLLTLGALYLRKSYNSIAERTGVGLFKTTGLVYLIGAATLIIIIGVFILIIAKILEIVSYFSIPDTLPAAPTPPPKTETL